MGGFHYFLMEAQQPYAMIEHFVSVIRRTGCKSTFDCLHACSISSYYAQRPKLEQMFRDTDEIISTLLKFVDIDEKTTFFQPDHIHLTPIKKWTPSKIPLGPLEDFQQIWVNHVDEYGQIVSNSSLSCLLCVSSFNIFLFQYYHLDEECQQFNGLACCHRANVPQANPPLCHLATSASSHAQCLSDAKKNQPNPHF